jgi:hypothetical protein
MNYTVHMEVASSSESLVHFCQNNMPLLQQTIIFQSSEDVKPLETLKLEWIYWFPNLILK